MANSATILSNNELGRLVKNGSTDHTCSLYIIAYVTSLKSLILFIVILHMWLVKVYVMNR